MKQLIEDLISAMEYHVEQTRPIHSTTVALQAAREALKAQPAPVQEPVAGQPLPCPFCGHIGLDFSDGETYRWGVASCGGCGASCGDVRREYPDLGEWHTEAIAEWNRRSPAAQPAPVQEPAFHGFMDKENCCVHICYTPWAPRMTDGKLPTAYYTTPPAAQRQWVSLTEEEIKIQVWYNCTLEDMVRSVEAKLKEKNT
jgi:hypothetical protein